MAVTLASPPRFTCERRTLTVHTLRRADPTKTGRIREKFAADVVRRFGKLIRALERALPDIIGGEPVTVITNDTDAPRYEFTRRGEKVTEFMQWLKREAARDVLGIKEGVSMERAARNAWSNVYIDTAYQRSIRQAAGNLKRAGAKVEDSWVETAFNRPVHADRLGLIYTRTFEELADVTEVMARQMSQALALGMAEGRSPLAIAKSLTDRVDRIGITRAKLIARTEVISAHAEASLNTYEEAGVEGVEVEAEWSTAGDDRVCPECADMEGQLLPLDEARGMIPLHPNCRCAFLPKVIGGSDIVLNWKRHAPRRTEIQRSRGQPPGAVPGTHAHHRACRHRGGGRPQRRAGHR